MYPEKITILIIEDNPADARIVKEVLAEGNGGACNLKYADSLSGGLKKISENTIDIVLLDLNLPDSSGLETITRISEKNKGIPLIVLTGTDDLDAAISALDIGAQDYLVKGQFDGESLSRSIRYAIERKKIDVELKKSESLYRSLFENMLNGFAYCKMLFDHGKPYDFEYLMTNSAFETQTGLKNVVGKKVSEVIPGIQKMDQNLLDIYGRVALTGIPETIEIYVKSLGMWFSISVYSPQKEYFVAVFDVITERKKAEAEIKENLSKLKRTFDQTITTLGNIIEVKDPYTSGHQKKVAAISIEIAKNLGLGKETVEAIRTASLIHDIGKISIPASILSKPSKLTDIERAMIETHPVTGYNILKEIDFSQAVAEIILQHHERINGSGYPSRLKGDDIMLEAKIIAVADVVEAMSSHRPYRPSLGIDLALKEIEENKGILYDLGVVDACIKLFRQDKFEF